MAFAEDQPISSAQQRSAAARHSFARTTDAAPMPNLNSIQRDSFDWFLKHGLKEVFAEISPIENSAEK